MSRLANTGHEALARSLAIGQSPASACHGAGYVVTGRHAERLACKLASSGRVKGRIEQLGEETKWSGTADLAPVIDEMARLALTAGEKPTAAMITAARGLLAEVARLKQIVGDSHEGWDTPPPRPTLSDEEWIAKHVPPEYRRAQG